jgi:hypothetical protein
MSNGLTLPRATPFILTKQCNAADTPSPQPCGGLTSTAARHGGLLETGIDPGRGTAVFREEGGGLLADHRARPVPAGLLPSLAR